MNKKLTADQIEQMVLIPLEDWTMHGVVLDDLHFLTLLDIIGKTALAVQINRAAYRALIGPCE